MTFQLKTAEAGDFPALHGILTICGEHMHRTQGYNHWYPYRSLDAFKQMVDPQRLYAIYDDGYLIGTFNLNHAPRPYYLAERWHDPTASAIYLGGFGILPYFQGKGAGSWAMRQIDQLAMEEGCQALRFDGAAHNTALMKFYERQGYSPRGVITFASQDYHPVMCFERIFQP